MAWRGPRTGTDPLLAGHAWRTTIRRHWQQLRLPCARCGRAIDYDGPRYLATARGRRLNPRYLIVGHKVSRYQAKRMGWTEQQVNALSNTQPECQDCSNRSGARLGQRVQKRQMAAEKLVARGQLDDSRRWYGAEQRACLICGCTFVTMWADVRTCGRACGAELKRRNAPPKLAKVKPSKMAHACPICGVSTMRQKYCSGPCQWEGNARANRNRYRERVGLPTDDRPRVPHRQLGPA